MIFFVILLYYTIVITYECISLKKKMLTPSVIFLAMQTLMFSGILTYVDFSNKSDNKLICIYFVALITFILGTEISKKLNPTNFEVKVVEEATLVHAQRERIYILVLVSIIACIYLFLKSGTNLFLAAMESMISGDGGDFTDSRLTFEGVSGVGYIYQFRVIILPILCAFMACSGEDKMRKIGIALFPVMIVFSLGTGQRGGFVMFVLMFLVSLWHMYQFYHERKIKTLIVSVAAVSVVLFAIMTISNGRVSEGGNVVQAVLQRIFDDNQQCAVIAFRYIDSQPIQYGKDWFYSMMDLLPGKNSYKQLSYVIFSIMYGTDRGTAPPCIWGSAYYNWWWFGIILMPMIMGYLYHKLFYIFMSKPITKLRIFIYSAMFVVLGNWIADSPMVLFNQGFITIVIMCWLLKPKKYGSLINEKMDEP